MTRPFLALLMLVVGCAHSDKCETGYFTPLDQKRADRVLVSLVASPTWAADLSEMTRDIGRKRVDCFVRADEDLLNQAANLSSSDSFVVEPHIGIGVLRAREWLKAGPEHANACAGK